MAKIKILKRLPKSKKVKIKLNSTKPAKIVSNKFSEDYLKFYDDIKTHSRLNDW